MKAIRKAKVTYAILFLVALVLFLAEKPGTVTYAASKKNGLKNYKTITVEKSQKIKGMVYSMEKNGDGYTVIAAKNGDQKTILSYCDSPAVTTNGKYVYYATGEFQMMSNYPIYSNVKIYQYNINTQKQKKIMQRKDAGLMMVPFASDGTYVYAGNATQYGSVYGNLTVINAKKKTKVTVGCDVSKVQKVKNKVLVSATDAPHGAALYLINPNGKKAKKLSEENVVKVKVKGKYIYFTEATLSLQSRECRCDLNGKNKKVLKDCKKILYLIFDYPHKHHTFKHFEV